MTSQKEITTLNNSKKYSVTSVPVSQLHLPLLAKVF